MTQLSLFLFGPLRISLGGEPATGFRTQKERALLAYLAVEAAHPHRREALAELFWPERPEGMARATLRQAITGLRRAISDPSRSFPVLCIDHDTLQINPQSDLWLDVAVFNAHIRAVQAHAHPSGLGASGSAAEVCPVCAQHLQSAVELYQGDFLEGVALHGCQEFHEWALVNREVFFRRQLAALEWLAEYFQRARNYLRALQYAQRQLELDPLRESAHQQLMRLLAWSGQRIAALEHYQACHQILAEELGVEPDAETVRLFHQIRAGLVAPGKPDARGGSDRGAGIEGQVHPTLPSIPHNLPAPLTSFVGRETELAHVVRLLISPGCRLLTLTGPGGVGKSRLALQAVWKLVCESEAAARLFPDGVWYIPLTDSEPKPEALLAVMAQTLDFSRDKTKNLKAALLETLRARKILLVLDNVESEVGASDLLLEILQAAPGVAFLVTSRVRLNYQAEFVLELEGLPYPTATGSPADAQSNALEAQFPAMQLFLERGSRVQAGVALPPQAFFPIAQICQLLDGLPLGIELAAASMQTRSCAQIAEAIQSDLDSLTVSFRDVPNRQRSLRVVFEHSWRSLTHAEQSILRQLAVFRGGFPLAAAEEVIHDSAFMSPGQAKAAIAHAPLLTDHLRKLVNKSLLQVNAAGRYDLHAVLKQYTTEKLAEDGENERQVRTRHSQYYLGFLGERSERLKGAHAKEALDEIRPELHNLRAAWEWAVANAAQSGQVGEIGARLEGLTRCYDLMGLYQEGEAVFDRAAQRLHAIPFADEMEKNRLLGRLRLEQAHFLGQQGLFTQAIQIAQMAFDLAAAGGDVTCQARAADCWGDALFRQGDSPAARVQIERAAALARQAADGEAEAGSLNSLAAICWRQGDHDGARKYMEQLLALAVRDANRRLEGKVLGNLGVLAFEQGHYTAARAYYQQAIQVRQALGDRSGESIICMNLGTLDLKFGAYAEARQHYERALTIHRQTGAREKEGWTVGNLGLLAYLQSENEAALEQIRQAMAIALETGVRPMQAVMWLKLGLALTRVGRLDEAIAAHQASIALRRALGLTNPLMESCAGLAEVFLAQGKLDEALSTVEEILEHLSSGSLDGTIDPFQIYLTCFRVLQAKQDPRAAAVLQIALGRLHEQAERIREPDLQRSFLENVPSHQALRAAREILDDDTASVHGFG